MKKRRKLYRDRFDYKIAGIFGGLGQYLQIDATVLRLVALLALLFSIGSLVIAYLIAWSIIPLGPKSYIEAQYKKLYRSQKDRQIAGICGGLAQYFNIDSSIVRLITVVALFATGFIPILIAYLVGCLLIQEAPPFYRK